MFACWMCTQEVKILQTKRRWCGTWSIGNHTEVFARTIFVAYRYFLLVRPSPAVSVCAVSVFVYCFGRGDISRLFKIQDFKFPFLKKHTLLSR